MQQVSSCSASSWVGFAVVVWWTGGGWNSYSHPSCWESYGQDFTFTLGSSASRAFIALSLLGEYKCLWSCMANPAGEILGFVSDFYHFSYQRNPRSPQIRVGTAGTTDRQPRMQAAARVRWRYRRKKSWKLLLQKCEWNCSLLWCKIAEYWFYFQLGIETQRKC